MKTGALVGFTLSLLKGTEAGEIPGQKVLGAIVHGVANELDIT